MGTDALGRDVLTELLFGARTLLQVSLPATLLLTVVATLLGTSAGYWGNNRWYLPRATGVAALYGLVICLLYLPLTGQEEKVVLPWGLWLLLMPLLKLLVGKTRWGQVRKPAPLDTWILTLAALLSSVPRLILLVGLAAVLPLSPVSAVLVLGLLFWPGMMRLIRAEMRRIRALPYIEAAQALGLTEPQILVRHAAPALKGLVLSSFLLYLALVIALETTLSFLGIGLPAEHASWGHLLAAARLAPEAWWVVLFPGGCLLLTLLSIRVLAGSQKNKAGSHLK
ncbi:ABC transporter permease [Hymenobacter lutimineralis]|uniref:ABC transporter permease n=1 Tax=Hymenobacter lutimineralis TaxID=2606448 RepID=A0A5D6V3Y2_9BACT|nr:MULTISPECIES: ABC transporter permease [Hymenobacter]QIX60921.1 ABC transporter permease [Hymenobacter sp. BT18]TYZ09559.1 ABC transporter permease [Hymenobacter lutimineralis]